MSKQFHTAINEGTPILSSTAKSAVSKGLPFAKAGHRVEITESTSDGGWIHSEEAHRQLEERLNPENGAVNVGSVDLHNALEELAMYSREKAKVALKRGLKEEEQIKLNALLENAQLHLNA